MQTRNMTDAELINQLLLYAKRIIHFDSASDKEKFEEVYFEILRRMRIDNK